MTTITHVADRGRHEKERLLGELTRARIQQSRERQWRESPVVWRVAAPLGAFLLLWIAGITALMANHQDRFIIAGVLALVSMLALGKFVPWLRGSTATERLIDDLWILFFPWIGMGLLMSAIR